MGRLSHGAKGIKLEGFSILFGRGKIMLLPAGGADHYTLQLETQSKIIDLHQTTVETDEHATLFAIPLDRIPNVLGDCAGMMQEFLRLFRPLRFEWLTPRGIRIVRGSRPVSDEDIAAVTRTQRGKMRDDWLVVDEERLKQNLVTAITPDEMHALPDGAFSLMEGKREIGIGFKQTDSAGNPILCWLEHGDVKRFYDAWGPKVMEALTRAGIPPEKFGELPFASHKV